MSQNIPLVQHQELRDEARDFIKKISTNSVNLMWAVTKIRMTKAYQAWGYATFHGWVKDDLCKTEDGKPAPISKSHIYALSTAGSIFWPVRDEVTAMILGGTLSVRTLIDLSRKCEQGMPIAAAIDHVLHGTPLPNTFAPLTEATDPESPQPFTLYVKKGDTPAINTAAMLYAVLEGHKTLNAAINAMLMEQYVELQHRFQAEATAGVKRFHDLIMDGTFYCKLCGDIPIQPTAHHVLPVSIGQGYGPQVLLCWTPCHEQIVQPQWERFCDQFLDEDGAHQRLKQEAEALLREHGSIPPSELKDVLCV